MRYLITGLTVLLTTLCHSQQINSYQATYSAEYNGMEITALHQLEQLADGTFQESAKARGLFGSITEQSFFQQDHKGQLIPLSYNYKRSLLGITHKEKQQFDWQQLTVDYRKDKKQRTIAITPGLLDIITLKLQIRRDLQAGKKTLSYPVISRGKLKTYHYRIVGQELLETKLGSLNSLHIERIHDSDDNRVTEIWLASDWDYLVIKLRHKKHSEDNQMDIEHAVIAGIDVQSLPATLANSAAGTVDTKQTTTTVE